MRRRYPILQSVHLMKPLFFAALWLLPNVLHAQQLDRTFGTEGVFRYGVVDSFSIPLTTSDLAESPGGNFYVVGGSFHARFDQDGHLDRSAGEEGFLAGAGVGIEFLPDGRFVVVGTWLRTIVEFCGDHFDNDFYAQRFLADGRLDTTFAGKGFTGAGFSKTGTASCEALQQTQFDDRAFAFVAEPTGRVTIAGSAAPFAGHPAGALLRLDATGQPDALFGQNGRVVLPADYPAALKGVVRLSNGQYVTAGAVTEGWGVVRLGDQGAVDTFFVVPTPGNTVLRGLRSISDGSVVAFGEVAGEGMLLRLHPGGAVDSAFGEGGRATILINGQPAIQLDDVEMDEDGSLWAVGQAENRSFVAHLNSSGTTEQLILPRLGDQMRAVSISATDDDRIALAGVDGAAAFLALLDEQGTVLHLERTERRVASHRYEDADAVGVAPDGTIVVGGTDDYAPSMLRVSPEGRLLQKTAVALGGHFQVIHPRVDGRVFVVGDRAGIAYRYLVGESGALLEAEPLPFTPANGVYGQRFALPAWSHGQTVLAGYSTDSATPRQVALARFTPAGQLDRAFGTDGVAVPDLTPFGVPTSSQPDNRPTVIAADGAGRILVAGAIGGTPGLVRVMPDGSLDNLFGQGGIVRLGDTQSALGANPDGSFLVIEPVVYDNKLLPRIQRYDALGEPVGQPSVLQTAFRAAQVLPLIEGGFLVGEYANAHTTFLRLNADGSVDESFGTEGFYEFERAGRLAGLVQTAPGEIVAAGTITADDTYDVAVYRFTFTTATPAAAAALPSGFWLEVPAPNPAKDQVLVQFSLAAPGEVTLVLFDALGRKVVDIYEGVASGGLHSVPLRVDGLAAGVYVLRLATPGQVHTQSLIVTH